MSKEKKTIIGFKCKKCGRINLPRRVRCLNCKGREFEEVELGDECKLVTYTQVYNLPAGVDVNPPLMLGVVEFPNGVRVMGQLDIERPEDLKIGIKLRPTWGKVREASWAGSMAMSGKISGRVRQELEARGKEMYGFKFELAGRTKK